VEVDGAYSGWSCGGPGMPLPPLQASGSHNLRVGGQYGVRSPALSPSGLPGYGCCSTWGFPRLTWCRSRSGIAFRSTSTPASTSNPGRMSGPVPGRSSGYSASISGSQGRRALAGGGTAVNASRQQLDQGSGGKDSIRGHCVEAGCVGVLRTRGRRGGACGVDLHLGARPRPAAACRLLAGYEHPIAIGCSRRWSEAAMLRSRSRWQPLWQPRRYYKAVQDGIR